MPLRGQSNKSTCCSDPEVGSRHIGGYHDADPRLIALTPKLVPTDVKLHQASRVLEVVFPEERERVGEGVETAERRAAEG